jgi:hypothetical protein
LYGLPATYDRLSETVTVDASCPCDLDPQGHWEVLANSSALSLTWCQAVTVLGEECLVLVWRGDVIRAARSAGEDHDVGASAVASKCRATCGQSATWLIRSALTML